MGLKLNFLEKKTSETSSSSQNTSDMDFSAHSVPLQAPSNRETEIKIGTIKRLMRDLSVCKEELKEEENRYLKLELNGEDEYVLRKQKQVIDECLRIIPDTERRLFQALDKLSKDRINGRINQEDISRVDVLIQDASSLLEHHGSSTDQ